MSTFLRTHKSCLERRLQKKIPVEHPIFAWLVEHVTWLLTIRQKGADGRTAYFRSRGRQFTKRMIGFGEACLWKTPTKIRNDQEEGKMGAGWRHGFFLGYSKTSNEYVYWDVLANCSRCARDGQRRPLSDRWNPAGLEGITKAPHEEHARKEPGVVFREGAADPPEQREATTGKVRDLAIGQKDLEEFGYTDRGCPRCGWALRYGYESKTTLSHSQECRQRIKTCLEQTEKDEKG